MGSAAAYVSGALYLAGYFAALGLPEGEIDFPVAYVMYQSFIPIIFPAFWLALVAAFCLAFSQTMVRPPGASVFFPIPAAKAIGYTLAFIGTNTLLRVLGFFNQPKILSWSLRSVVLFAFGLVTLVLVFRAAKRAHSAAPPPKIGSQTATLAILLAIALGLGVLKVAAGGEKWPYSPAESAMFVLALSFIGWSIWREFRKAEIALAQTGEWTVPKIDATSFRNPAGTVFLAVVAVFSFLLHAGLVGTANGNDILSECDFARTVQFDPAPESVGTMPLVLILHRGGFFYVLNATNHVQVIPDAGLITNFGWKAPAREC